MGCGALGASIARLLAQAGVGSFMLVDSDEIAPHNTSRHILGQRFLGQNKAKATAKMLEEDFPHILDANPIHKYFHCCSENELVKLADCDVIVSAGIDYEGDAQIDFWRHSLSRPPVHVCTWAEPFAIVGHAVALFGKDTLLDAFDDEEQVRFRLTDWPFDSDTLVVEAGCGNVFQPHGAIELQATVNLAAGLALDVLVGTTSASFRRVWQGKRAEVSKRGGTPLPSFAESNCIREYPWQ